MEANTENKQTSERNTIVITICSTKGGVGKTTLAANIGGLLADLNYKILLIDGDIQPSLSTHYTLCQQAQHGLTQLITFEGDPKETISKTSIDNLDIVMSDDPDNQLTNWITARPAGRTTLKHYSLPPLKAHYDFIIIDSIGTNAALQHTTVLAADILISPIPPDIMSAREFSRGTLDMVSSIEALAPIGQLFGVIYRKDNTREARIIAEELSASTFQQSRGKIRILETIIPHLVVYKNAVTEQCPVHRLNQRAKADMCDLVSEILPNLTPQIQAFREEK